MTTVCTESPLLLQAHSEPPHVVAADLTDRDCFDHDLSSRSHAPCFNINAELDHDAISSSSSSSHSHSDSDSQHEEEEQHTINSTSCVSQNGDSSVSGHSSSCGEEESEEAVSGVKQSRDEDGIPRKCPRNKFHRVALGAVVGELVKEWSDEYVEAAEANDVESMLVVGQSMLEEDGWGNITYNPCQGKCWLTRAKDLGCQQAQLLLNYYFPKPKLNVATKLHLLQRGSSPVQDHSPLCSSPRSTNSNINTTINNFNSPLTQHKTASSSSSSSPSQPSYRMGPTSRSAGLMSGFLKFFSTSSSPSAVFA